jgi:hypothetical protein
MHPSLLYRSDVKEAVRLFRPVLRGLKIRSAIDDNPVVFFAAFDELAHLSLDICTVQVVIAEMDLQGMFLIKLTKQGSLRAFIILNKMLYNNPKRQMKELLKTAGVHEFVHFLAMVYTVTVTDTIVLREKLMLKLQKIVKKLPGTELLTLYNGLMNKIPIEEKPFTDAHYRLDYEGPTPDYHVLFLHFMFSRELFETYFDKPKQLQFKTLMNNQENDKAIKLIIKSLNEAAEDKDVPITLALSQLMEWTHVYMKDQ